MLLSDKITTLDNVVQLISVFLLFLFVLFLAYLAARISGSLQANSWQKNRNIKVIEVFRLTNNKLIEIVQIGQKYYALAVGKDEVHVICQMDEEEVVTYNSNVQPVDFKTILEKMKKNDKQKNDKKDL